MKDMLRLSEAVYSIDFDWGAIDIENAAYCIRLAKCLVRFHIDEAFREKDELEEDGYNTEQYKILVKEIVVRGRMLAILSRGLLKLNERRGCDGKRNRSKCGEGERCDEGGFEKN